MHGQMLRYIQSSFNFPGFNYEALESMYNGMVSFKIAFNVIYTTVASLFSIDSIISAWVMGTCGNSFLYFGLNIT